MKLYILKIDESWSESLVANILSLRLRGLIVTWVKELKRLILIANGTPDDKAVAIICHHLNSEHETVAGITKPLRKGLEVFTELPTYVSRLRGLKKILVVLDQENQELAVLKDSIYKKIRDAGVCVCSSSTMCDRAIELRCEYYGRVFTLILVINGMDKIRCNKHTIEDHFLTAALSMRIINDLAEACEGSQKRLEETG